MSRSGSPYFDFQCMVRVDPDGCFRHRAFQESMETHGIEVDMTAGEAPWQHGICERMVGMCKTLLTKMALRGVSEDVEELMALASHVHGSNYTMNGFTPHTATSRKGTADIAGIPSCRPA